MALLLSMLGQCSYMYMSTWKDTISNVQALRGPDIISFS
jgi:hypothetical protein